MTTKFINQHFALVWARQKLTPSPRCTDEAFIRRVSLDLAGRIALPDEVLAFVKDDAADKRQRLVDRLLASDDYLDYWANLWVSWLLPRTVASGTTQFAPFPAIGRLQLHAWLTADRRLEKLSYRQLVTELLTATGPNNVNGATNFVLGNLGTPTPPGRAEADGAFDCVPATLRTLRLFLGYRLDGLQLKEQPKRLADWQEKRFWQFNVFFRQVDCDGQLASQPYLLRLGDNPAFNARGVVIYELPNGTFMPAEAVYLDGKRYASDRIAPAVGIAGGALAAAGVRGAEARQTRRQRLAAFITADRQFPRAFVNRIWGQLFGRGLNERPAADDFGSHNEVIHGELLDRLARDFVAANYDAKALLRWIAASDAYQRASSANVTNDNPVLDVHFSRMPIRPLAPEQLTASLLRLVRPAQPGARDAFAAQCVAWFGQRFEGNEWEDVPSADRLIHLLRFLNRRETAGALLADDCAAVARAAVETDAARAVEGLYLAALNRLPTAVEMRTVRQELGPSKDARAVLLDAFWVLLNSSEFVLQH